MFLLFIFILLNHRFWQSLISKINSEIYFVLNSILYQGLFMNNLFYLEISRKINYQNILLLYYNEKELLLFFLELIEFLNNFLFWNRISIDRKYPIFVMVLKKDNDRNDFYRCSHDHYYRRHYHGHIVSKRKTNERIQKWTQFE